jgi:hypothetical protein
MFHFHKSPGYFWFRIFGYGIHAKSIAKIKSDGWELYSLRNTPYIDCCGWRLRWLVPDKAN